MNKVKFMDKKDKIYVGSLGNAIIDPKGKYDAYYVLEEDGTKSWQLRVDENSDKVLRHVKVRKING
jgi:hypothetical protein